jgi:outer membrane protein assembly factor BamB
MRHATPVRALLAAALCVGLLVPPLAAQTGEEAAEIVEVTVPGGCADPAEGGEWRTYGGDLQNTRSQPLETVIGPDNVGDLEPAFVFDTASNGGGIVNSTPIVADGCVYFGTSSGYVFALNADTGELVWRAELLVDQGGLLCSGVVGSTAVADGRVFAIVSQAGAPYIAALDQVTGETLWSEQMDDTPGVYNCASPVVFDGMVIAAFTGDQTGELNRGGYAIFDVEDGELLAHSYTIPQEDIDAGMKGGGIWSTPAIDEHARYAYVGTSNPDSGHVEHERTNAIIKIDLDRERETFGEIVDSYKGTPDGYVERPHLPTCIENTSVDVFVRGITCAQMDLDMGASPQLTEGPDGRMRVSNLQKSGVYHMADAETMEGIWEAITAPPTFYGSAATAAYDGERFYVATSPPGHMVALDEATGMPQWVGFMADAIHYQGVTYANGVVYTNDAKGFLNAWRASDGMPLLTRPMGMDAGRGFYAEEGSGSVTVARNTVYVGASDFFIAYRP